VDLARDARSEANFKRLEVRDAVSAALIKRHTNEVTIISPTMQEVIKEEKNQGFKKQNYYYKNKNYRRNSFSGFSHGYDSSIFQLAQAIQKLNYNNQFFPNGGGYHRRIPSNLKAVTSLHTQETHVEEEAIIDSVETKNIRQDSAPERGGENIERGSIINTGKMVAINKWIQSNKERDYAYIYQQTFSRKRI
jgi:predicted transcriptional regulator